MSVHRRELVSSRKLVVMTDLPAESLRYFYNAQRPTSLRQHVA